MAIRNCFRLASIGFSKVQLRPTSIVAVLVLSLHLGSSQVLAEDVVVVINKENRNTIDLAYVAKIYSGALRSWPDGSAVIAIDYPEEAEVRVQFSLKVLNRSVANMRAVWSQNIFSGKGLPPRVIANDEEIKRTVAANKYAIGYLPASQVDSSVKVLAR
jgi:ABC-type phosphate transport system substrate-binding protein